MIGKEYFGTFADIKDPSEEENDETEANNENIVEEDNNETLRSKASCRERVSSPV